MSALQQTKKRVFWGKRPKERNTIEWTAPRGLWGKNAREGGLEIQKPFFSNEGSP